MKGSEFERRVRRLGALTGTPVRFTNEGKGSHGRLYYGERCTTLKDRRQELEKGLLLGMCRQLEISLQDLFRVGR